MSNYSKTFWPFFILVLIASCTLENRNNLITNGFPKPTYKSLKKAKVVLTDDSKEKGYIYDIDDEFVYLFSKKGQLENALATKCIDCLKIPVKRVFEIQFKKLNSWGQGGNAVAVTMILGAVINTIRNQDPDYAYYDIVILGIPGAIIFTGNSLTQLARTNKRTITQKELKSSSFEESKGFYLTEIRKAYFDQVKSTLRLYDETVKNNPNREDFSVLIADKSGYEMVGYITKFEKDVLHFTRNKNILVDLRKSRSDTPDTIKFEDIASLQKARKK